MKTTEQLQKHFVFIDLIVNNTGHTGYLHYNSHEQQRHVICLLSPQENVRVPQG